jgi:hypothetical protein
VVLQTAVLKAKELMAVLTAEELSAVVATPTMAVLMQLEAMEAELSS